MYIGVKKKNPMMFEVRFLPLLLVIVVCSPVLSFVRPAIAAQWQMCFVAGSSDRGGGPSGRATFLAPQSGPRRCVFSRRGRFAATFFDFGSQNFDVLVQKKRFWGPPEGVKNHWILLF